MIHLIGHVIERRADMIEIQEIIDRFILLLSKLPWLLSLTLCKDLYLYSHQGVLDFSLTYYAFLEFIYVRVTKTLVASPFGVHMVSLCMVGLV